MPKSVLQALSWFLVFAPVTALIVASLIRFGAPAVSQSLRAALLLYGWQLLIAAPFLAIAWITATPNWQLLPAALAVYLIATVCLVLPATLGWNALLGLEWNWLGKALNITWLLALSSAWSTVSAQRIGLTLHWTPGWLLPVGLLGLALSALAVLGSLGGSQPSPEATLFQLTMPGLDEELLFRGVLLTLLNTVFGTPWSLLGVNVGWGGVISSVLFAAIHITALDKTLAVRFNPGGSLTLVGAFAFLYVRERTGSVWSAVIVHNLVNTMTLVGAWLAPARR